MVTFFGLQPESAIVRHQCGMAPRGQMMRVSASGIAAMASHAARVLPSPVRSPRRNPQRPAERGEQDLWALRTLEVDKSLLGPLMGDQKAEPIAPERQTDCDVLDQQLRH